MKQSARRSCAVPATALLEIPTHRLTAEAQALRREFEPLTQFNDRALVQTICALRFSCPTSTSCPPASRQPPRPAYPMGITTMSAGSHTEPGGYTGAGNDNLHYTERGNIRELAGNASEWTPPADRSTNATGQFDIADERPPETVAETISRLGYDGLERLGRRHPLQLTGRKTVSRNETRATPRLPQ